MKKRIVVICFFLFSLLINIIPLFVLKDKVAFSNVSIYPVSAMIVVSIYGIDCYIGRHKKNYLSFGSTKERSIRFGPDREVTFTKEYARKFYWQFIVYWVAIPFYIPCVFFSTEAVHLVWTLCVIFVPQVVYLADIIVGLPNHLKENRDYREKREQELEEQKKREELGYFK